MQEWFVERNHLLRPTSIRASSSRPSLFYMVRRAQRGHGSILDQAAAEACDAWERSDLFDASRDKIGLYVRTRGKASDLTGILDYATYTARNGSTTENMEVITRWIEPPAQPFLVATSAFAEGFDHPHVRLVINVNEPESLVLFAQESGCAGRDGERAYSLVLFPSEWEAMTVTIKRPVRAGVRKLQDYFACATRPAAILLLFQELNDADMIRRHADQMRHLISTALPSQESRIGQMTPLGMLQKMTTGFMP
ncbi:hypothetical protein LTR53_000009 [Teratosphaeriaceae sp. CCFEE 6253]|nr:hypothetical protein LTR53_000009 [Teratosphaeriaceae sp. CCFEE 6253]